MPKFTPEMFDERRRLREQFPTLPLAFSSGGPHAHLVGPLGGGLVLGRLVVVEVDEGDRLVGQVQSLELAEASFGEVEASVQLGPDSGEVRTSRKGPAVRFVAGEILLLGCLSQGAFAGTAPTGGFGESPYRNATDDETRLVLEALAGSTATFEVGSLLGGGGVAARLKATGFSRHTFLCGQSGSGKTYATGVLLERLRLATSLPVVIFDPNSDHVHLGEVRPDAAGEPNAEAYRSMGADVMVARARGRGGNQLLAIHYSDLEISGQTLLLGLDPTEDLDDYAAFRTATTSLPVPYSLSDVVARAAALGTPAGRQLATRIENIGLADWGLWCRPGEVSLVDSAPLDQRCVVFDLGSLDTPAERVLVASAALRWLWRRRDEKRPVLLVIDEAHNVFPARPGSKLEAAATDVGIALAAEGRKYGLHLLLASQRPSKVHANVVSQCDNLALLRVNSVADVDDLCRIFSHVPPDLIKQAPGFSLGQVLFAGPIAPVPLQASVGRRLSPEGGADVPTDWAAQ